MVALAPNTSEPSSWDVLNGFPKLHSRAREVKTRICTESPYSKSLDCVEIWLTIYESCDGLESFTRDPIGYRAGMNLFMYVGLRPLDRTDPSGFLDIRPYVDPPSPPWFGSTCAIAVRCFSVSGPITIGAGYHCGLYLSNGAKQVSIDGTGGDENNFDWQDPYNHPPDSWLDGDWVLYPQSVCDCLMAKAKLWNTVKIPRHSFGCNSNTSLRCLNSKCGVNYTPSGFFDPKGYYGCKEYNCKRWGTVGFKEGCRSTCLEYEDFCDFFFGHAENGTVPVIPPGHVGSGSY